MQQKYFLGNNPLGFHHISYTEWGQKSTTTPLLCVHGLTRNGRDFDHLAKTFEPLTQIFCPDIVGRGQSDWLKDPTFYGYSQYLSDMTAFIARVGSEQVDWVGTSMGGIIGMLIASQPNSPIRRLVINDVGPFIPMTALNRISEYVAAQLEFDNISEVENHLKIIYSSFGIKKEADWQELASHSFRKLPNGKLALAHDPGIAKNFVGLKEDVNFWNLYDLISCPTLLLHGAQSDILTVETAQQMCLRGPKAKLVTFQSIGHAPSLMDQDQIQIIGDFLN